VITGTLTTAGTFTSTVSATNAGGTGTKTVTITVTNPTSTPYLGTPWPIPGTIQAENYDDGGEGIAYHDNDAANNGAQQRMNQGVDVENTGDNLGGTYNVGHTNTGEWMRYTVTVQTTGVYTLQARVASPGTGNRFRVELDGSPIATINIPNTTAWQTYQTVSVNTPSITAGSHVLRIYEETGGFNLNYITFISTTQSAPVINSTTSANATLGNSFTYNITANNTPTSYNATGLPGGLSINTSTGLISGTPTNTGTSNVTISATNTAGTGTATLSLNVTVQNDPAGTITAYRNLNTITVNGSLNETGWNLNKSITKTVFGTANNTTTFGALWDNTNLYIGVRVLDGNLYSDSPEWWEDDAVELYIDANNNKLSTYDGLDNQIIKGYNKPGISTKLNITGLQHAWATASGGYTIEFAIPWSQLGISPTSGTTIGFDIGYNDDDNGGTREGQAMWNGTIDNWQNTSQFGTLKLNTGFASKIEAEVMSLENTEAYRIRIQPNIITDGLLNVLVPSQWSENTDISIYNANGLLLQTSVEAITNNFVITNISGLKSGMYFMKITKGAEIFTEKFIIQ
jgi:PKD repeat protein